MVCSVLGYYSRYISLIFDHPDIGRMQKCGAKVKSFFFFLAFWSGSGCFGSGAVFNWR